MPSTVDKKEIEKFSRMAKEWWDPNGKFKPLHLFNPARIKFIKEKLISHFSLNQKNERPLAKLKILDIGCGGGLLCEPLYRLGAQITGIDASKNNINIAKAHSKEMNLDINYIHCLPEQLDFNVKFDVILNMEIVEHVSDLNYFIKSCTNLLKKDGIMFIATINRTLKSYLFAILGAEYILKWLPIGTHDWNLFVRPEELIKISKKNSLKINEIHGITYNPILDQWKTSKDTSVNYISSFIKK